MMTFLHKFWVIYQFSYEDNSLKTDTISVAALLMQIAFSITLFVSISIFEFCYRHSKSTFSIIFQNNQIDF